MKDGVQISFAALAVSRANAKPHTTMLIAHSELLRPMRLAITRTRLLRTQNNKLHTPIHRARGQGLSSRHRNCGAARFDSETTPWNSKRRQIICHRLRAAQRKAVGVWACIGMAFDRENRVTMRREEVGKRVHL